MTLFLPSGLNEKGTHIQVGAKAHHYSSELTCVRPTSLPFVAIFGAHARPVLFGFLEKSYRERIWSAFHFQCRVVPRCSPLAVLQQRVGPRSEQMLMGTYPQLVTGLTFLLRHKCPNPNTNINPTHANIQEYRMMSSSNHPCPFKKV